MLFINFKTYPQASGSKAIKLAKICQAVSLSSKIPIIPCVQAADLSPVVKTVRTPVWVQHLDAVEPGKNTGFLTAESVKLHGAAGTLLNHSEHPLSLQTIAKAVNLAKRQGLQTMVLLSDLNKLEAINKFKPDYIGLEEPALIGGKTAMVELEKFQQIIREFARKVGLAIPVIGAGISSAGDIRQSLALGAKGVLVASAVVLAEKPQKALRELAAAFR